MIGVWCIAISNLEICSKWPKKQGTKDMKQIKNLGIFIPECDQSNAPYSAIKQKKLKSSFLEHQSARAPDFDKYAKHLASIT